MDTKILIAWIICSVIVLCGSFFYYPRYKKKFRIHGVGFMTHGDIVMYAFQTILLMVFSPLTLVATALYGLGWGVAYAITLFNRHVIEPIGEWLNEPV